MLLSDQLLIAADCPPNVTLPVLPPKLLPLSVTTIPGAPLIGFRLLIVGASTVKAEPLLCKPPAVTTTLPLLAPLGTIAVMLVFDQPEVEAACPLKVTVPVVPVKLFPAIVIDAPGSPLDSVKLLMTGGTETVKLTPLLTTPPAAVTTTLPVVAPVGTTAVMLLAFHAVITAGVAVPVNVTLPVP